MKVSSVHPRDSAWRLGDPLAPSRHLAAYAQPVWWRPDAAGKAEAVLFRVDRERLEAAR